jgi:hypothetical protein
MATFRGALAVQQRGSGRGFSGNKRITLQWIWSLLLVLPYNRVDCLWVHGMAGITIFESICYAWWDLETHGWGPLNIDYQCTHHWYRIEAWLFVCFALELQNAQISWIAYYCSFGVVVQAILRYWTIIDTSAVQIDMQFKAWRPNVLYPGHLCIVHIFWCCFC